MAWRCRAVNCRRAWAKLIAGLAWRCWPHGAERHRCATRACPRRAPGHLAGAALRLAARDARHLVPARDPGLDGAASPDAAAAVVQRAGDRRAAVAGCAGAALGAAAVALGRRGGADRRRGADLVVEPHAARQG